jgi:hypothetical protein
MKFKRRRRTPWAPATGQAGNAFPKGCDNYPSILSGHYLRELLEDKAIVISTLEPLALEEQVLSRLKAPVGVDRVLGR